MKKEKVKLSDKPFDLHRLLIIHEQVLPASSPKMLKIFRKSFIADNLIFNQINFLSTQYFGRGGIGLWRNDPLHLICPPIIFLAFPLTISFNLSGASTLTSSPWERISEISSYSIFTCSRMVRILPSSTKIS